MALAQNIQLQEEEAIKDSEREEKLKIYIEELKAQDKNAELSTEEMTKNHLVEVEPNNVLPSDISATSALVPYKFRRPKWGQLYTLTYSQFHPVNYKSDFSLPQQGTFDDLYGSAQTPLLEFTFCYKRNFSLGSIGGELSYGMYENEAASSLIGDAVLSLQIVKAGVRYTMDNLFVEPMIAPYVVGGAYTVIASEEQPGNAYHATTQAAPYWSAGLLLNLGWLDKYAAVESYVESGIENTFAFVEMRQFLASGAEKDPDFSTEMDLNLGLSLEF